VTRDWHDQVVYQIYPRSFADSNGDGVGDLPGILEHLDHLVELGVDVVWLSPVYPSPQVDNGYDISDYQAVDLVFGTLADLDELIARLHERGIALMLDLVVNHTSDQHPWFQESRRGTDSPKRDWYWWRPPRDNMAAGQPGAEPTNWGSSFGGPAWTLDETTNEYYLHLFAAAQPDLNWENDEVRRAVHDMMRWWLDRGVDGFRMDVINMISKDPRLPDGRVVTGGLGDGSAHYINGPRLHEFLQEMHREVFASRPGKVLTVGEMPGVTVEEARLLTAPERAELDLVFQFEHVQIDQGASKWDVLPFELTRLKASLGRWQAGLANTGWNSLYWNNHDQPRVVSRFGDDGTYREASAKLLATVLHLHQGTPFVYQGEELGMTNHPFTGIEQFQDVESLNHYRLAVDHGVTPAAALGSLRSMSRDNARTPMQWSGAEQAGFTTGLPWLAVNPNHTTINAQQQRADPGSVFHHYRRLIELRHTEPAVREGRFSMLMADHERIYAFTRDLPGSTLLVVANVSDSPVDVDALDLPPLRTGSSAPELLLTNYPETVGDRLRPWEARVYRLTS
jgi:oligo-1,6-glucosidase